MFGLDLVSVLIGCALGATFPAFFKMVWGGIKASKFGQMVAGWFSK
jgi:hypothetical protein